MPASFLPSSTLGSGSSPSSVLESSSSYSYRATSVGQPRITLDRGSDTFVAMVKHWVQTTRGSNPHWGDQDAGQLTRTGSLSAPLYVRCCT